MAYKVHDAIKKSLKESYEKACNAYLCELLNMWGLSHTDGFWVSDEVGGVYCHEACISMNMEDIIFCVEKNISLDDFREFVDYTTMCGEYNFNTLSIKAYFNGAPQIPKETFDKLNALKKELMDCVEETKRLF